jgi:hypothetical protein
MATTRLDQRGSRKADGILLLRRRSRSGNEAAARTDGSQWLLSRALTRRAAAMAKALVTMQELALIALREIRSFPRRAACDER